MNNKSKYPYNSGGIFVGSVTAIVAYILFFNTYNEFKYGNPDIDAYFSLFWMLFCLFLTIFSFRLAFKKTKPKISNNQQLKKVKPLTANQSVKPVVIDLDKNTPNTILFDFKFNQVGIGRHDLDRDTYTRIPLINILDYEIVSNENSVYKATLGGALMWGPLAARHEEKIISSVKIKIYIDNIRKPVEVVNIVSNGKIKSGDSKFQELEEQLDKFVAAMKLVNQKKERLLQKK